MDEYGQSHSWYIWPGGDWVEGTPFPEDFNERVEKALRDAGLECEST